MSGKEIFAKTIYAEARGESREGQEAVGEVIKTRASMNRGYWGGSSVAGVCRAPRQFECWNNGDIRIDNEATYRGIRSWSDKMYDQNWSPARDARYSRGADHYNNPDKETADWTRNCTKGVKIGGHQFYHCPN